ncbi:MAG: hypothetical protein F6K41_18200 [Symploca sp. SIO3E6]|nr:hypothetical protein [Caldora sp. SIO3E6]
MMMKLNDEANYARLALSWIPEGSSGDFAFGFYEGYLAAVWAVRAIRLKKLNQLTETVRGRCDLVHYQSGLEVTESENDIDQQLKDLKEWQLYHLLSCLAGEQYERTSGIECMTALRKYDMPSELLELLECLTDRGKCNLMRRIVLEILRRSDNPPAHNQIQKSV